MENNILSKLEIYIVNTNEEPHPEELLLKSLVTTDFIYSYLVYIEYKNNTLLGWSVEFLVSQTIYYNTIVTDDAVRDITEILQKSYNEEVTKSVIGYKQPPLDLLIEIFDPLVKKLAFTQKKYWQHLDYDDLCQICRMSICNLYNKGYYIHNKLIMKAFMNDVLISIRKDRYKPIVMSFDEYIEMGDDDSVTLLDIVYDKSYEENAEEDRERENNKTILNAKRELIIELLGSERQYKQLVREYGNKNTTPWARTTVQKIKKMLENEGITNETFSYLKE